MHVIALTLRQRDHIVDLLLSPSIKSDTTVGNLHFVRDEISRTIHGCSFQLRSGYKIQFRMGLYFARPVGLATFSQYTIWFSSADSHPTGEPIFACPHLDLVGLIRQKPTSDSCDFCHTSISQTRQSAESTSPVIFNVTRVLGGSKWLADQTPQQQLLWKGSDRLTRSKYSMNSYLW